MRAVLRDWPLIAVLAAGLVLRVVTQVAYRPALVYIDSDRYLRGQSVLDPLGYRVLLWPLQRAGGLAMVVAVQHILGLAMACAIYALLRRHGVWRWAAAVAVAPVLLDGYQLQAEQTIMPDVMFEALIVAALALLLWRSEPSRWQLATAGLLLGASVDVRQVGEVAIVPTLAFVLVRTKGWGRRLVAGALIGASFAAPVLGYMTARFAAGGPFAITERDSYIFYGRVAAVADCARLRIPADERSLCPSRRVVDALGIDGLVGDPAGPLISYRPPPGMTIQAMAVRFERAVAIQQPMAVAGAIDHDFLKLFALTRDQDSGDTPISRWQFQASYPTYPPLITLRYVASVRPGGSAAAVSRPLALVLRDYQLHGGYTPGPMLALAVIAGLAGVCCLGGRGHEHTALAGACLLATGMGGAILIISDSFEFSWRYQLPALISLPMGGVLGFAAIVARVKFEITDWRASDPAGLATAQEGTATAQDQEGKAIAQDQEGKATAQEGTATAQEGTAIAQEGTATAQDQEGKAIAQEGMAITQEGKAIAQDQEGTATTQEGMATSQEGIARETPSERQPPSPPVISGSMVDLGRFIPVYRGHLDVT